MDLSKIDINNIPFKQELDSLDINSIPTIGEQPIQKPKQFDLDLSKPISDLDFGDVVETGMGGAKEIFNLGKLGLQVGVGVGTALLNIPETIRKTPKVLKTVAKNSPQIAKGVLSEFMQSFGDIPDSGAIEISVDRAFDKFKDKPISTFMDWMVLTGVVKGATKIGIKNIDKMMGKDLLNTFKKNVDNLDELTILTGVKPQTKLDDVIKRKEIIRNLSSKQLDETDTVGQYGRIFAKNIDEVVKKENMRLDGAIKYYADDVVDTDRIFNNYAAKVQQKGLETIPLKDSNAVKLMNKISKGDDVTVNDIHQLRRSIADNINYANPEQEDRVLKLLNQALKDELVLGRPEILAPLDRIHNRLEKFQGLEKNLKKSGGGEKFAQNFFNTREELEDLEKVLSIIPEGSKALTDLKTIDAWNKWNAYVGTNADILPRYLNPNQPFLIPVRELSEKSRGLKGRLSTGAFTGMPTRTLNRVLNIKDISRAIQVREKFNQD
jgi:hypothetical protein